MAVITLMTKRERVLVSVLFIVFSMLMVGASKITGSLNQVDDKKKIEDTQMLTFVNNIKNDIDFEDLETWETIAKNNPQFIFKINSVRLP